MNIYIYDVEFSNIPIKDNPAFYNENCLIITIFNKALFKTSSNRFILHQVIPSNEAFNVEKLKEIGVFKDIDTAKRIAKLLAIDEDKHFINK